MRRLEGMQLEAAGKILEAGEIYKEILREDETNVVRISGNVISQLGYYRIDSKCHIVLTRIFHHCLIQKKLAAKRQVMLLQTMGRFPEAIDALVKYLDINYTDFEGWLQLADLYLKQLM